MSHAEQPFHFDGKLKANIFVAVVLILACPLALWFLYFRYDHTPGTPEKKDLSAWITSFCRSYNKPEFHSKEVFADTLSFMNKPGVTTVDVDHDISLTRQVDMYPRITLVNGSMSDTVTSDNLTKVNAWLLEIVYVKPKMQFRSQEVQYHFEFDDEGRITAIDTLGVRNVKFGREMPK